MRLIFLGTGTSTGIPQIGCKCKVCTSTDPHDRRLRTSALVEINEKRILIDCGPDFREQILRVGSPSLDALLVTHSHYDHVGGIDDLRPYCYRDNGFDIYCRHDVSTDIHTRMPYCFAKNPYPGVPIFNIHKIESYPFYPLQGIKVTPLPVMHANTEIVGFRIESLAYITDCLHMPETTIELIRGVDTLVINALRHEPHQSHMNLSQALDIINKINPHKAYLTHLSHQMGCHADINPTLPNGVEIAYDGLTIEI